MSKDESDVTSGNTNSPDPASSGAQAPGIGDPFADVEEFDGDLDEDFAPRPKQRLGAVSIALIVVLVAGLGFLGGVVTQKHSGTTASTGAGGFGGGTGRGAALRGEGGFAAAFGGGAAGGGGSNAGTGAGTGGTGTGSSTSGSDTSETPAVIGTLVSVTGDTAIVRNLAGKEITVHLSGDTTVSSAITAADLKSGQTVTIAGSTGADGSVTATSVNAK